MSAHAQPLAVITGVGTLGAVGIGLDAVTAALQAGEPPPPSTIDDADAYRRPADHGLALRCRDLDLKPFLHPGRARRMSDLSRMAVAAARLACADAGLPVGEQAPPLAVALATAFGPGTFTERLIAEIVEAGPRTASPFLFTDCVANAPAGQVAIDLGARGPNVTVCQREAGPLLALIEGSRQLAAGRAEVCLAGAVEEIGVLVHAVLARMGSLCPPDADGHLRPRPFQLGRAGHAAAEGATIAVLESEDGARARGAAVRARLRAAARAFDPTASRSGWGRDGEALGAHLRARLAAAGVEVETIDAVVAGASGSPRGDAVEAALLRGVFAGRQLPPVFVPKAVLGEWAGGTLAAAMALGAGAHATLPAYCRRPDPALGVAPHDGPLPRGARRLLLTSAASGGATACVVLDLPQP